VAELLRKLPAALLSYEEAPSPPVRSRSPSDGTDIAAESFWKRAEMSKDETSAACVAKGW
jgi:hypothetical protein